MWYIISILIITNIASFIFTLISHGEQNENIKNIARTADRVVDRLETRISYLESKIL